MRLRRPGFPRHPLRFALTDPNGLDMTHWKHPSGTFGFRRRAGTVRQRTASQRYQQHEDQGATSSLLYVALRTPTRLPPSPS